MRKTLTLDALFSKTRQGVLAATLTQPERAWYLSDLARHLGVTPSSLQRELAGLVRAGILNRRRDGNRTYYQADPDCPLLPELRGLMVKTAGLADVLRDALRPFAKRIRLAFIYGSVARAEERSSSDVDLLVVGSIGLADLAPALKRAESRLQRPVNPLVYSEKEFATKLRSGHHLLTNILKDEVILLIGDSRELESLTRRKSHPHAHRKPAGA
jgi:DNA-binding transcriptional ArsR family regulator